MTTWGEGTRKSAGKGAGKYSRPDRARGETASGPGGRGREDSEENPGFAQSVTVGRTAGSAMDRR